jgi:hypothetical protein
MATKRRFGMRAGTAWKSGLVALVSFCLLASGSLVKSASGQDEGPGRTITLGIAKGIDRVSNLLSLNRPLDWIDSALDRHDTEPDVKFPPTTLLPVASGTTTTTVPPPTISAARPLQVKLFGDSQGEALGAMLQRATANDADIHATYDTKISTGLARPDYYNWPARIVSDLEEQNLDIAVVHLGANDDQALRDANGKLVAEVGTPAWDAEYRRRIAGVMDLLHHDPLRVVWIGQPTTRDAARNAQMQHINALAMAEASLRPWVTYVDTTQPLDGPGGTYVDYLTPPNGQAIRCRQSDGVHLTFDCDRIVISKVLDVIRPMFPVATTTTTLPSGAIVTTTTSAGTNKKTG